MTLEQLTNRFDEVILRVEEARRKISEHHIVKIVAVSKNTSSQTIRELYKIGQRAFGENRVQDLKAKTEELADLPIEWHFIGRLQTNKINHLIDLDPFLVQSLDSIELASELDKRLSAKGKTLACLLQINSAHEETKAGVEPERGVEEYLKIKETFKNIHLKGVMTIGAHTDDQKVVRQSFEITHRIYEELIPHGAKICSMGMSNDYELAIECGSNMIRLGSILFA